MIISNPVGPTLYRSFNRDGCEIRRLLTPETAGLHFSHQTANNPLVESAKRLVRREVSPRGTALIRINAAGFGLSGRSEEHTSELQSQSNLVCRLLLEKKKTYQRELIT